MNKRRNSVIWNVRDILSSTRVEMMTLEEEGAYRRALDKFYLNGYLPFDLDELRKMIGKDCSLKVAEKVRGMFKQSDRYPNLLTHDYLNKFKDGEDVEAIHKITASQDKIDWFKFVMVSIEADDHLFSICNMQHGLTRSEYESCVKMFTSTKLATKELGKYRDESDVRSNFIYWIPYSSLVKHKHDGAASRTNPKSVTSKLKDW